MQTAGLLEAAQALDPDDVAMAADFLGLELLALQAEGVVLITVERPTPLAIVAGTAEYTLSADTLDVMVGPENIAGTWKAATGAESPVRAISRHEYQTGISDKTTSAAPAMVYIERGPLVKLVFWPVPNVAGTFRYDRQRLPRDMDQGNRSLDLARKWSKALMYAVAWQYALAKSAPLQRVTMLRQIAEAEKATARQQDVEHINAQFYVPRSF